MARNTSARRDKNYTRGNSGGQGFPHLSLKERDRRYANVRKAMAGEGIDVLLCPASHNRWGQMMADSRYLTSIGGFSTETLTIFPLQGDVTACIYNGSPWWKRQQNWVTDVRNRRNDWSGRVIERLGELAFPARGRIGISALSGLARGPDGYVPHTLVERIKSAYPEAHIVDATGLMEDVRAVKSAEEIKFMERSVAIAEKGLDALTAEFRVGATERHLYAALVGAMIGHGAENPSLIVFATGPGNSSRVIPKFTPLDRVVQLGDLGFIEAEAPYGGYCAQLIQTWSVGKPKAGYMEAERIAQACYDAILRNMRPGVPLGNLVKAFERTVKKEGKGRFEERILPHLILTARGLGDERPSPRGRVSIEEFQRTELRAGMTFVLKPRVTHLRTGQSAIVGNTVAVTRNGARRLGKADTAVRIV